MTLVLPEKRAREEINSFTLKDVKFEPSINQFVCIVTSLTNKRKNLKIPISCLTLSCRELIEENINKKADEVVPNEKKSKKISKEDTGRKNHFARPKNIQIEDEIKTNGHNLTENYLFTRMKEIYDKGNYLFHKPIKIIACHAKTSVSYSVLFSNKSGYKNCAVVSHSILIEKFPELFIDYIAKINISVGD